MTARARSGMLVPAALTKTSTRPKRARTSAARVSTASFDLMSQGRAYMRSRASAEASSIVLRRASSRRAMQRTCQPAVAREIAVARPTPEEAPVMTAMFDIIGSVVVCRAREAASGEQALDSGDVDPRPSLVRLHCCFHDCLASRTVGEAGGCRALVHDGVDEFVVLVPAE